MKRSPLRRRPRRPKATARGATKMLVWERSGRRCECGCGRVANLGWEHHVFPKAKYPELADELDNLIATNAQCHARHESAFRRFPRYAVRRAERLATTEAMRDYLDSHYERRPLP